MIADQPCNKIGFGIRQTDPLAGGTCGHHAFNLLITFTLASIVQQHGKIKSAAILDQADQALGQLETGFPTFHISNMRYCPQCMLVDSIMMIHVELGLRNNSAKLRDEPAKHTGFIHAG
ncbi:MAG: Uncharacterised protein [Hyphomonas sp. TMED17]|nr:MAG: Uncharacterised protein [Hyphomonas sp. TMED17]